MRCLALGNPVRLMGKFLRYLSALTVAITVSIRRYGQCDMSSISSVPTPDALSLKPLNSEPLSP